jgi:hypothetical protein
MRCEIIRRIETLATVRVSDDSDRAVVFVTHYSSVQVLAGKLASLKVEAVAIAVVGRHPEDADVTILLKPPQLPIVWDVTPN